MHAKVYVNVYANVRVDVFSCVHVFIGVIFAV